MPDYIYLLENRLSVDQQSALRHIAHAARAAGMNVFLVGGSVRDLTSGSSVRDLDVAVQGNALKLKKNLEKAGGTLWGEHEPSHTLYFRFPVGVRVEVSSTRREEYPKPGKPIYHWDSIHADLRRRDFTVNAMALSLNEHSYGLLMDPLNGVADIEARQLQLVGNYGFLEDPSRLIRATRLSTRLGWELEERTKVRYQNAKEENAIQALSAHLRGYELEEIGHEEDGLHTLQALEAEGWMHFLDPAWTVAKADATGLAEMHKLLTQLQMQGISPDASAASLQLLTAKLQPKDLAALKKMFVRPGFVEEWDHLDAAAKEFAKQLTGKEAATPSATWKLFTTANPQAVLWLGFTSKAAPILAKYKNLFTTWPEAKQKVPHALMQELRITQELPNYGDLLHELFLHTIDEKLETEEQLRAFLAPYSPPAPPPPVTVRRTRSSRKGESKAKVALPDEDEIDLEDVVVDHDAEPEAEIEVEVDGIDEEEADEELNEPVNKKPPAPAKAGKKHDPTGKPEASSEKAAKQPGTPAHEAVPSKAAVHPATPVKAAKAATGNNAKPAPKDTADAHPSKKSATVKVAKAVSKPAAKAAPKPAAKKAHTVKPVQAAKPSKKSAPPKKSKAAAKPAKKR